MTETNSKSVAALSLGVLSLFIPFIGLILGVIGIVLSFKSIREINSSTEGGKGLAIAGRICSVVGICIQLIIIVLIILFGMLAVSPTFEML